MAALFDTVEIYLNAPTVDNMYNSIIESFTAAPVVSTSAGGIPYIATDGETGY